MKHRKVAKYWNKNAKRWIKTAELGLDVWRDSLNTTSFINMLPTITGFSGLEIGCGEGHNSRLIARRCKTLTAIDICVEFITHNQNLNFPANLIYQKANAIDLPFDNESFDFAIALMAFMDMAEINKVLMEIYRVLKKGGFLQFSITHPCFNEFIGEWMENDQGDRYGFLVKRYFIESRGEVHEWQHFHASSDIAPFRTPRFVKPLSTWFSLLLDAGFLIEKVYEPYADKKAIAQYPVLASTRMAAHSLMIRTRK